MTVRADGRGDFRTLQAALEAVGPAGHAEIRLGPGLYREKVVVEAPGIRLVGEDPHTTFVAWDDSARRTFPDGRPYGTFQTATLRVSGPDFRAENLTFENTAGPGEAVGQALAAYVDGDRAAFENCRFLGRQDTLFTGPLPPAPLAGGPFGSPRDEVPRVPLRQSYRRCFFAGDVDFLFGSATAVFEDCEVHSLARAGGHPGWATAASTPEGVDHGYAFFGCRFTGDGPPGSAYLGRPWRNHARTLLVGCWLGPHLAEGLWSDWDKAEAQATAVYGDYGSTGPGAALARVPWAQARAGTPPWTPASILAGDDGWAP